MSMTNLGKVLKTMLLLICTQLPLAFGISQDPREETNGTLKSEGSSIGRLFVQV